MFNDKGGKEEPTVNDEILLSLENEFAETMSALEGTDVIGRFRLEYEKMYRALKKSHETEVQLLHRCQDMTQNLLSNAAKMHAAVKLAQGDHSTIEALKKEIEKAWRTVDSANDNDLRAKEMIRTLKQEVASLQAMVREGSSTTTDHTATLEELKVDKKRLQTELEEMSRQIETLTRETQEMLLQTRKTESETFNQYEELHKISDRLDWANQEYVRERNMRERAERQLQEVMLTLTARENDVKSAQNLYEKLEGGISGLRSQLEVEVEKRKSLQSKVDTAEKQLYHTQQSYNDSVDTAVDLNNRLHSLDKEIQETEKSIVELLSEKQRVLRVKDNDFKELGRLVQQNDDIRQEHENLNRQKANIDKRIEVIRRERAGIKEALTLLTHEHEILKKHGSKEDEKKKLIEDRIASKVEQVKELEESIEKEKQIATELRAMAKQLEKDRSQFVVELSQINLEHNAMDENLKLAMINAQELKKEIEASDQRLSQQQASYETLRSERNQFSKKLIETQDEIVELKQKFKMMDHQLGQFRQEIQLKEKRHAEELSKQKAAKELLAKARKQVGDNATRFEEAKKKSSTISQQIKQLVKTISVCDKELSRQQQQFLSVSAERDTLGSQLIRRNDELALLYEKLSIQQETLNKGEDAYRARQEDMRLIRLKTNELRRQCALAHERSKQVKDLKAALKELEFNLAKEQANVVALSEGLENPKNNTRWRAIGSGKADYTIEEINEKMKKLQKRLIKKSEENLEKEMSLQEKERLVTELRTLLANQPGPEVAQQLNAFHKDLQKRNNTMKQKASELNMTATHITELKYEAERLRRELHETKRKYYDLKMSNDEISRSIPPSGYPKLPKSGRH